MAGPSNCKSASPRAWQSSPWPLARLARDLSTALAFCMACSCASASPWIDTGNQRTRHHIHTLADAGKLSSPTTSWPLMWSNLKADLDAVEPHQLNEAQLWSYHYLKHELRKAMKTVYTEQSVHFSNRVTVLGDFSSNAHERYETGVAFGYTGNKIALKLQAGYTHEPADGRTYRADGSYINYLLGNWAVGVGAYDRWWGPGWESSLILGNNARPLPSLYLQRNVAMPVDLPILSWLGPWQLTTFMSQLESYRHVPNAKLWGMRLSIKPLRRLELGMSRTAQWGGKGRPNDVDTFIDLLLGRDNLDDFDANDSQDRSNEPGNQLAGIDWRWGYAFGPMNGSFYGQFIGEDEAGGMPSRSIGMAGIEANTLLNDVHARFSLEGQNTTVYFYDSDKRRGNVAYEHSIYKTGYRYHDRSIGSSADNDAESIVLRSQFYLRSGHNANLSIGRHRLNIDASGGNNPFGTEQTDTFKTQISYSAPLSEAFLLKLSLFNYSTPVVFDGVEIDTGGYVSIQAHW